MATGRTHSSPAYGHNRPQAQRSTPDAQRNRLDPAQRSPVAGRARPLRPLADGVRLLSTLEEQQYLRPHPLGPADPLGSRRPDRLGSVVHRWLVGPDGPSSRRHWKRSLSQHPQEPEDHALGRSRGGWGSKFHPVTDGRGLPLAIEVTPGPRHESVQVETVMDGIAMPQPLGRPRELPKRLAGDKDNSYPRIRRWLPAPRIKAVVPPRSNERKGRGSFEELSYRRRSVIEQCVGWLKECRRIGTRFEKLAISFLAMLYRGDTLSSI